MAAAATVAFSSGHLLLSCACLILLLFSGSAVAAASWGAPRRGAARACGFDGRLEALEPRHKARSEAGSVEYYNRFDAAGDVELDCAGFFPIRVAVDPRGLVTARYANAHALAYIVQGGGVVGLSIPGCPAPEEAAAYQPHGEHQNVHRFQQGDVVAVPAGVRWIYNDGEVPLVFVYVFDTNNNVNQLEPSMRKFLLAGGFGKGQFHFSENIFKGIDVQLLSEAMDISLDVAEKLQSRHDQRGEIVRVEHGLHLPLTPPSSFPHYHPHHQTCGHSAAADLCTMEVRQSVEAPDQHADAYNYNPGAGRITRLTSRRFPIMDVVQMSAVRVDLYQDAVLSPFWSLNAHNAMYAIHGRARVQVATDNGTTAFDGVLRAGQLLVVPQNYLVAGKALGEGFQYISFETSPDPVVSHFAGRSSVLRDLPVDVIASSYGISRDEAAGLKNNRRREVGVFAPRTNYHQGHGCSRAQE